MKKSSTLVFILLAVAGIIVAAGAYYTFQKNSSEPTPTTAQGLKTFKSSETMDFTIEVPVEYEVEEWFEVLLIDAPDGELQISQNGTNYDNLDEHIAALEELNRVSYTKEEDLIIDGSPAQRGTLENERIYFIFSEDRVYALSTEQPELYDDLDQIARSFRYTPN